MNGVYRRCPKFGGFCDLCSKHGCCALKQPLWEQPLHIVPKPVPRYEPTIPRMAWFNYREYNNKFLIEHFEPIEGSL